MSLRRAFLGSPHHAAMAAATLGIGFATGEPLYFLAGTVAYVLGWVYLPDLPLFRRWIERKDQARQEAETREELAGFRARRDGLLGALTLNRRQQYAMLANVCRDIEQATSEGSEDPRVRKLEELMWTYLRLLTIEQSLQQFLESETREDLPAQLAAAEADVTRRSAELAALKASGMNFEPQERLLASRQELLETLGKRHQRLAEAKDNLALVLSEQERLDQQIKLIRADSIATKNAAALSARIDATVEHLEATNHWLSQMDQFRDLLTDLPPNRAGIGFGDGPKDPPPLPARRKERA